MPVNSKTINDCYAHELIKCSLQSDFHATASRTSNFSSPSSGKDYV